MENAQCPDFESKEYTFVSITGHQRLNVLKDVNSQLVLRLPRHEERIEKLYKFVEDLKVLQVQKKDAVERKRLKLKKFVRAAARQLTEYIFPLRQVAPNTR